MDGFIWAAFTCYLLAVVIAVIFGFMYLLNPKLFNYHEWALGKKWEELDFKLQTLLIAFMRGVGGAIVALSLAIAAMIIFAFRSGEMWSYYVIPIVSLIGWGIWLYVMMSIRKKTNAKAPIFVPAVGIVLIVVGFILSFF
ncbi:hypothetical protein ACFLTN_01350 [Chloroflexota bacterium]